MRQRPSVSRAVTVSWAAAVAGSPLARCEVWSRKTSSRARSPVSSTTPVRTACVVRVSRCSARLSRTWSKRSSYCRAAFPARTVRAERSVAAVPPGVYEKIRASPPETSPPTWVVASVSVRARFSAEGVVRSWWAP
uniref:hypothetical protein n=1 Tax=Streptomyces albidoflavus TaxID=1886 RepID=UPI003F65A90A